MEETMIRIEIGQHGGAPATMDIEELLATRLLVQGNSGSGKSHLLRLVMEGSANKVQQVIIDPEGDFVNFVQFGHAVIDASKPDRPLAELARCAREQRVSCVLNLEHLDVGSQVKAAGEFLEGLFDVDREHWHPILVVVDEAQLFAPQVSAGLGEGEQRALQAMTNLMCRGRKRGMAGVIATQRLAKLHKNVAAEATNFLMGRTYLDIDMRRAADLLGISRRDAEMFRSLNTGEFYALGPALTRSPTKVRVGATQTRSRAQNAKLNSGWSPKPLVVEAKTHAGILGRLVRPRALEDLRS
jgi:hypothetical protein